MGLWTKTIEVLVLYDIQEERIRDKIVNACKDYGLIRVQKSIFRGDLTTTKRREMIARLNRDLGASIGNIQIYPLGAEELRNMVEMGERLV